MITFKVPCNYFNLVPMGMDRCYIIEYSRLLGSNCTDTSSCGSYRKLFVSDLTECTLVIYFSFIIRRVNFINLL